MFESGQELKKLRKESKISQARLSIASGVSEFRISRYECGYDLLTPEETDAIIAFLYKRVADPAPMTREGELPWK